MKKIVAAAILGLAAVVSTKAQTYIQLYNYGTPSAGSIVYGQFGGDTPGSPVTGGYTVGFYWASGNIAATVNSAIGGATTLAEDNQGSLAGSGLTLAMGPAATAPLGPDGPGIYDNMASCIIDPSLTATPGTITLVLVAYNGASYETSIKRGHSAAFTMTTGANGNAAPLVGAFAPPAGFAIATGPEPSTFAIAGLGLASLLYVRRRK